jgi:hypothetical protein
MTRSQASLMKGTSLWSRITSFFAPKRSTTKPVRLSVERLEGRWTPDALRWIGPPPNITDYSWSRAANWDTGHAPTSNDDVTFTGTNNIQSTANGDYTVKSLKIEGGYTSTITLGGTLTVTNGGEMNDGRLLGGDTHIDAGGAAFTWTGGIIETRVYIAPNAQAVIRPNEDVDKLVTGGGEGGDIQNFGKITWSLGGADDKIGISNSASIHNFSDSIFEVTGIDATGRLGDTSDAGSFFVDQGAQLRVPGGIGPVKILANCYFENTGTVSIDNTELQLNSGFLASGTFALPSSIVKLFVNSNSPGTLANATISQGVMRTMRGGAPGNLQASGTITVSAGALFQQFDETNVVGSPTFNIGGTYSWLGGEVSGAGVFHVLANAFLGIGDPMAPPVSPLTVTNGWIFVNEGTVRWNVGNITIDGSTSYIQETISNYGLFDIRGDQDLIANPAGEDALVFHNYASGTLRKSAGAGNANIGMRLRNSGTVTDQSGRLNFSARVQQTAPGQIGLAAAGMSVGDGYSQEAGCSINVGATATFDVTGDVNVYGGTVGAAGNVTVTRDYNQSAGASSFESDSLSVGRNFNQSGGTTTFTTATVTVGSAMTESAGTMTFYNASITAGSGVVIASAATFYAEGADGSMVNAMFTSAGTTTVHGKLTVTGVAGTAGTVQETGGNLFIETVEGDHAILTVTGHYDLFAGNLTMLQYGTLDVSGTTGTGLLLQTGGSATIEPTGGLQVASNYELDGGNVTFYYGDIHIYGQMQVNAGLLLLGSDLTVDGGVIIASGGTVEADYGNLHGDMVNNGMLTFGAPDQTVNGNWLTIYGSFGQTSTGVMVMGMGYAEFDRLEVFGAVGLAGTFTLLFEPGYSPNLLGGYDFIEYQSRSGTFDFVNVPGPPDPYYWIVWYSTPPEQPGWFGLVLTY